MELNENVQEVVNDVVENVKPNFFEAVMNNQKLIDGGVIVGAIGGIAFLGWAAAKVTKDKIAPMIVSGFNTVKEKIGKKNNEEVTNVPVDVVDSSENA